MLTTTDFLFSERIAVLVAKYPGDDREAVRYFAVLHDVRRFDLACISVVHTISDVVSSNARYLQPDEHPTSFMSTLTIPMEVMHTRSRDARGGDDANGEIVDADSECGPAKTVEFAV
jgi:hypothetical protein